MKKLTIIIPFRNEGDEVFITLEGIRKHCCDCEVIVINDASDNDYDYSALETCGVRYITNNISLGVAGCRDLGVELADTPCVLFLDAHMRIESDICTPIIGYLSNNPISLVCLQTAIWVNFKGEVIKVVGEAKAKATYIDFSFDKLWHAPSQMLSSDEFDLNVVEIPCIMGAAYGINKKFYQRLHGLRGLEGWGMDEQLLSTKVWLSGGTCVLFPQVHIGHVYRVDYPYKIYRDVLNANKLFLTRLFLPEWEQNLIESGDYSDTAIRLADMRNEVLKQERENLKLISVHDMDFIINLNKVKSNDNNL